MEQILTSIRSVALSKHAQALAFSILIGLGASWRIPLPFSPVPMTGQTLFLMLGAAYLTRYFALEMVAWYLAFGFLGAPFFANQGSGFAYLLGPTGGYLVGFALTGTAIGFLIPKVKDSRWGQFLVILLAGQLVFLPGVAWLKVSLVTTWSNAIAIGFVPFIIGDIFKILLAFGSFTLINRKK